MNRYIAFGTKGLIDVSVAEVTALDNSIEITDVNDKRVTFNFKGNPGVLRSLKTIDDVILLVSNFKVSKDTWVDDFDENGQNIKWDEIKTYIRRLRDVDDTFSITFSIYKNNYVHKDVVIESIGKMAKNVYPRGYIDNARSATDIRILIDEKDVYIGVRVFEKSLYKREYITERYLGALKPTVAASMIKLVVDNAPQNILDPFCGSGTILCEALLQGHNIYGADKNPEVIKIAQKNLSNINGSAAENIKVEDVVTMSWQPNFFDCVITNFPWNEQIPVKKFSELYDVTVEVLKRVVKSDAKMCFLCKKPETLIKRLKFAFPAYKIEHRKIGMLGQTPDIVIAKHF